MSYIDRLIENCLEAQQAKPTKEFSVENLESLEDVCNAIYVIEELGGNPETTYSDFARFKENTERKCAKLNSPTSILYVGSSRTGLKKRIDQHMGLGHPKTYALQLKHWFTGKWKITVWQYDVSAQVLQILEDDLSDRLRPAFGKQGGNNK